MVVNSFRFCLFGKLFLLHFWAVTLLGIVFEVIEYFLVGVSLIWTCYFHFAGFKNVSLSLTFIILITMCLGVGLFGFILLGTFCASWTWICFLPRLENFQPVFLQTFFLCPSLFSFSKPYNANISVRDVIPKILFCPHFLKILLFYCPHWVIVTVLSSRLLIHPSMLTNLLSIFF